MKKIVFMGTPDFAVPVLESLIRNEEYHIELVVTQPDRPKGRKRILTPPPVKVIAENHNIPVFQPEKIKNDFDPIKRIEPDLIVTAAFGQLLPKPLLDIPKYGCINVHASLLPKLRGGAPIHYSLLEGHEKTGITIMYMAEKLDAGDIISQKEVVIEENDNVETLHNKLSKIGADLLIQTLPSLFTSNITPFKQNEQEATFAPNISREQEVIDWSRNQRDIFNHIRGLCPWPVAYTKWNNHTVKIWQACISNNTDNGDPGEVLSISEDAIIVATGDGKAIEITELQPAGKKKMHVADFVRGIGSKMQVGEKLG
ncbi:methionyl-tRNA formyltransferase [Gracilibacillus marinus]|uniref:Methionyl-tRNA formyltransferase n=1 Tax=Gracilibacillus marinus TaxID=630535 RepID=A0ABV8VSF0_9BACI